MTGQVIEITNPGYWIHKTRGFLEVLHRDQQLGRVPLDDIAAVIVSVPGCSISTVLLDELSQRNIPLVVCGANYLPCSWTLPVSGHNRQFQVMRAQIALSEPQRKRAWQRIVRSKITNQAEMLLRANQSNRQLLRMVNKVRSGDPDNYEAQAARFYWQTLFGSEFRRNPKSGGLNTALNYCYTVVRACVARAVCSAGLHPSFSLHHRNPQNPLNLVDDLMEPYRPVADYMIWLNTRDGAEETYEVLTPEKKTSLAAVVSITLPIGEDTSPLSLAAAKMCRTFADYCLGNGSDFHTPSMPIDEGDQIL
ncbi:MAG: type II CRISPR-associated endonuclease Cas1 [Pseudohongiellaceae bacterium]